MIALLFYDHAYDSYHIFHLLLLTSVIVCGHQSSFFGTPVTGQKRLDLSSSRSVIAASFDVFSTVVVVIKSRTSGTIAQFAAAAGTTSFRQIDDSNVDQPHQSKKKQKQHQKFVDKQDPHRSNHCHHVFDRKNVRQPPIPIKRSIFFCT